MNYIALFGFGAMIVLILIAMGLPARYMEIRKGLVIVGITILIASMIVSALL